MFVALLGSLISFYDYGALSLVKERQLAELSRITVIDSIAGNKKLDDRIAEIEKKVDSLAANLGNATETQLKNAGLAEKLSQFDSLKNDLDELKYIILDNPSKALTLPLIRKDIAEIEKRQADLALATQAEVGRIYDFSKWFLALMITLAVGLVTMGFIQRAKK